MIIRKYFNLYLRDERGVTIFEKAILLAILGIIILFSWGFLANSKSNARVEMVADASVPLTYKNKNADPKDTQAFEQAVKKRTLNSFVEYAKEYPDGKYINEASDFAYGLLKKERAARAYEDYLDNFSTISRREDVQATLSSLNDEFIIKNMMAALSRKKNLTNNKLSEGCQSGDCNNGEGVYIYSSGAKYEGNFSNGQREGRGYYNFPDGGIYHGSFKNGKYEGVGIEYYSDGRSFKGQFKNDERDGRGRFRWPDGEEYDGQWKNGQRNGEGTQYNANGTVQYEGEWVQGEPK